MTAAGTQGRTDADDRARQPDDDALFREQEARADAEDKRRRAAEREAQRPVCKRCGKKFTDQRWEETTMHRTAHDADLYKERNTVERLINKLKAWRGVATRYDKSPESYLAGLHLRASMIWIDDLLKTTA